MIEVRTTSLLPRGIPRGEDLMAAGRELATSVELGVTRFAREEGVRTEREFRERGRAQGQIFTALNIGMKTWEDTAAALRNIERECRRRGVRPPDHFQFIPERRMGLPKEQRVTAMQETGPVLWTEDDWREFGQCVAVQPQAGDNMIGSPASVVNAIDAIRAGSSYVGCLSQFSWRWPYFDDDVAQVSAVVTACALVGAKRDEGVLLDTYLEDGYPGVFHDYASLVGWAALERWVAGLMGAPLSVSWGGLTADPITKSVVTIALERLNPDRIPGSFVQGDTISYGRDLDRNMAICSQDVLYMMLVQHRYQTGACALPVPLTEMMRIPTWQEITQVQILARQLQERVPELVDTVDWTDLDERAEVLASDARRFCANVQEGLEELDVDARDPFQILLALRRLGPQAIEERWGVGEPDARMPRGRRVVYPTELVARTLWEIDHLHGRPEGKRPVLAGTRVVVASTDVHEMAKTVLTDTLMGCGAHVVDAGINCDPEDVVRCLRDADAHAAVVTTHNGVAWSYGSALMAALEESGLVTAVYMGGVLNEDVAETDHPLDVTHRLNEIGILTPGGLDGLIESLTQGRQRFTDAEVD